MLEHQQEVMRLKETILKTLFVIIARNVSDVSVKQHQA
jgi:hypothetical protein